MLTTTLTLAAVFALYAVLSIAGAAKARGDAMLNTYERKLAESRSANGNAD